MEPLDFLPPSGYVLHRSAHPGGRLKPCPPGGWILQSSIGGALRFLLCRRAAAFDDPSQQSVQGFHEDAAVRVFKKRSPYVAGMDHSRIERKRSQESHVHEIGRAHV